MTATVVLCGGAQIPRRAPNTLALSLPGRDANITLRLEALGRRMVATLPGVLIDLLEVAAYVFCADQRLRRGGSTAQRLGAEWRRDLRFVIPGS